MRRSIGTESGLLETRFSTIPVGGSGLATTVAARSRKRRHSQYGFLMRAHPKKLFLAGLATVGAAAVLVVWAGRGIQSPQLTVQATPGGSDGRWCTVYLTNTTTRTLFGIGYLEEREPAGQPGVQLGVVSTFVPSFGGKYGRLEPRPGCLSPGPFAARRGPSSSLRVICSREATLFHRRLAALIQLLPVAQLSQDERIWLSRRGLWHGAYFYELVTPWLTNHASESTPSGIPP